MNVGDVGVLAVCSDYRFQAGKTAARSTFMLDDFKPTKAEDDFLTERTSCRPVFATSYLDAMKIDDFLTQKVSYARPTSAVKSTLEGKRVIKVVVQVDAEGGGHYEWPLYFLPESWAFAGASQDMGGLVIEYRVGYESDDPLRVKSIKRWVSTTEAPQVKHDQLDIDVNSIAFRTVPDAEFRLAALGLEEPAIARMKQRRLVFVWTSAAVFGGLGVLFAVLYARRRAPQSAVRG
jgi:hypothetical protein